jgi:hypothetical protein
MAFVAVVWNEADWRGLYPQFSAVTSAQLDALWEIAVSFIDNQEGSIIPYDPEHGVYVRKVLLYALMCHLATIATQDMAGQPGTLTNASEGSVSAGFYMPQFPAGGVTAAWYNQTPCGRTVWALLRKFSLGGRYYAVQNVHPFG